MVVDALASAAGPALASASAPYVSVAIRVKPAAHGEAVALWAKRCARGRQTVCCHKGYLLEELEFSRVAGPEDDNRKLFRSLQGPALAASVFTGVNETLFAYGQTGSGKTHTIFGTGDEPGLLRFFVESVFEHAHQLAPDSTIHVCCYEVLGDVLTDLLDPTALLNRGHLLLDDVVYDELFLKTQKCRYQIVRVTNAAVCMSLLESARMNRTAGVSSCNSTSSRSHGIVHLFVQNTPAQETPAVEQPGATSVAALTLVDLAGAEREHENPTSQGRKSARLLNTSLSSLNRLLRKLQTGSLDESERRQSVLNKCLWEYLRAGCGIALIFCVSPLLRHRAASLSTLSMATDSKLIRSKRRSQIVQPLPPEPTTPRQKTPHRFRALATSHTSATVPRRCSYDKSPRSSSTPASRTRLLDFGQVSAPLSTSSCGRPSSASSRGVPRPNSGASGDAHGDDENLLYADSPSEASYGTSLDSKRLRRRLSTSRVREECELLGAENTALRRECDSLRALFIRQQQQQIAFWGGPFMDMVSPTSEMAFSKGMGGTNRFSRNGCEGGGAGSGSEQDVEAEEEAEEETEGMVEAVAARRLLQTPPPASKNSGRSPRCHGGSEPSTSRPSSEASHWSSDAGGGGCGAGGCGGGETSSGGEASSSSPVFGGR
eukprot:TRINITY_DN25348_c0_g1_i3.p1 TRINITY_DN25348_c0_g1~~TRINITY_DN25348_c0_g1_i3.p1  ORF type:complete len:667 (+),score=118.55 TRINITY_DN25348_c0_g1_i3:27-2003(+)